MKTYPKTPSSFKRQAERGFARVNSDAEGITFEWTFGPKRVTWADGTPGFSGTGVVRAPGFRPSTFVASALAETYGGVPTGGGSVRMSASGGGFLRDAAERILAARR